MKLFRVVLNFILSLFLMLPPAFSWEQLAPLAGLKDFYASDVVALIKNLHRKIQDSIEIETDPVLLKELNRLGIVSYLALPLPSSQGTENSSFVFFLLRKDASGKFSLSMAIAENLETPDFLLYNHNLDKSSDFNVKKLVDIVDEKLLSNLNKTNIQHVLTQYQIIEPTLWRGNKSLDPAIKEFFNKNDLPLPRDSEFLNAVGISSLRKIFIVSSPRHPIFPNAYGRLGDPSLPFRSYLVE